MHEPDEQGICGDVVGNKLDNACGENIESGEMVLILRNDKDEEFHINLATLIAMARGNW